MQLGRNIARRHEPVKPPIPLSPTSVRMPVRAGVRNGAGGTVVDADIVGRSSEEGFTIAGAKIHVR